MDKPETETPKKTSQAPFTLPTFTELIKSTAIHGAILGNLSGSTEENVLYRTNDGSSVLLITQLITYSRDIIRIYNVELKSEASKNINKKTSDFRLRLTHEVSLFGEIKEVGLIRHPEEGNKGYLVVLFNDEKMSTLTLDNLTNTLATVDLHNFENPGTELLKKGQQSFREDPILRVDKFNRCIGILMYKYVLTLVMTNSFYQTLEVNLSPEAQVLPNYASLNKDPSAGLPFYGMTYYFNLADYNLNNPVDFAIVEHAKELRIYILNQQHPVHNGLTTFKPNVCELVGFKLNKKFFTTPLWEKNKIKSAPKENLEIYDCCMKFKFLPSDCFKVLCLPRGGFLIMSPYTIFYFDIVKGKDECIGFLVNQQYANTDAYAQQYYRCTMINRKPESQINLKNYRFEILDSRHILLTGVDAYLLRLDLRKEGLVENMELVKVVDLNEQRFSFVATHSRPYKDGQHVLFLGSYMTNAQILEIEVYSDPKLDLQTTKRVRLADDIPVGTHFQMENVFYKLYPGDTIQTLAPINDLLTPKTSNSNPFHLIASCSYGVQSALLFMQTKVDLKPVEMCDVESGTQYIISVKDVGENNNFTKYLLLSQLTQTEVQMGKEL